MRFGRSPTAPVLPIAMIGISARPAGSSRIKLHRLPACEEGGRDVAYCDPERASPWLSICTASLGEFRGRPVELRQHRVVNVATERTLDPLGGCVDTVRKFGSNRVEPGAGANNPIAPNGRCLVHRG